MDLFKSKVVAYRGPAICRDLTQIFIHLKSSNTQDGTPDGTPRDVQSYVALERIGRQIEGLKQTIQEGGVTGYEKMNEAREYMKRLQQRGLEV